MGWEGGTYGKKDMFIAPGRGKIKEKGRLETYAWSGR